MHTQIIIKFECIPKKKRKQHLLAFIMEEEIFCYTRMPFGLKKCQDNLLEANQSNVQKTDM